MNPPAVAENILIQPVDEKTTANTAVEMNVPAVVKMTLSNAAVTHVTPRSEGDGELGGATPARS